MKRKILKMGLYIIALVMFINITKGFFEDKLMELKYSYYNVALLSGNLTALDDGRYELSIMVENNSSEEAKIYDYYVNLYSDSKLKNEIYYHCEEYKENAIPGGSIGNAIWDIYLEEDTEIGEVFAKVKYIGQDDNNIKLNIIEE